MYIAYINRTLPTKYNENTISNGGYGDLTANTMLAQTDDVVAIASVQNSV
jgi:hypothetical protein